MIPVANASWSELGLKWNARPAAGGVTPASGDAVVGEGLLVAGDRVEEGDGALVAAVRERALVRRADRVSGAHRAGQPRPPRPPQEAAAGRTGEADAAGKPSYVQTIKVTRGDRTRQTWNAIGKAQGGYYPGSKGNCSDGDRWLSMPWAIVFPTGGPFARHPSQLYEAALEGLVLFAADEDLDEVEDAALR